MRRRDALLFASLLLVRPPMLLAEEPARTGVLVLAHGGTNQWNSTIRKAVKQAKIKAPLEVALGMGMHRHEVKQFQGAVDRLTRKGINRLLVIPLLVSSHSEVYRQFEYLVGARADAAWPDVKPLRLGVPVVMRPALDADPVVGEILLERARALSRQPDEETVILVAHGPNDEADNALWLADMRRLGERVKSGGFRQVASLTLRDDAPKAIQEEATQALRQAVQQASEHGRALVVPLLIATGGIERKIPQRLAGLSYRFTGRTLLPHPKLSAWIAAQTRDVAEAGHL